MAVKLRMQRHGSKKKPFYFIVAANSTSPRDGKFIEKLGTYNPLTVPATINLDREKALDWLQKGAQPTNTVRRILSFKGVLYMKHLMRGVSLGLFDESAAMEKFENWNKGHEELVAQRESAHKKAKQEKRHAIAQASVKRVEEKNAARQAETEAANATGDVATEAEASAANEESQEA
ncbi:MAG TPA: 30S ribosomal protein S16 [Edaphocola sp.]|nr:30S ribosomal protein S16 [Edaphocola sp.]